MQFYEHGIFFAPSTYSYLLKKYFAILHEDQQDKRCPHFSVLHAVHRRASFPLIKSPTLADKSASKPTCCLNFRQWQAPSIFTSPTPEIMRLGTALWQAWGNCCFFAWIRRICLGQNQIISQSTMSRAKNQQFLGIKEWPKFQNFACYIIFGEVCNLLQCTSELKLLF